MKRGDLQGIRANAIISVLLFHFFPNFFPNGYLGVDQFFVLSGFLMTMIFGSKEISFSSSFSFYYRRAKRIVPLYLFIILLVLLLMFLGLPNTFIKVNIESAKYSVLFTKNIAKTSLDNSYFIMLRQADDLFTHTWSLAVEMQFYLFVPLLFLVFQFLDRKWLWAYVYLGSIGLISYLYHLDSDSTTSFNSVFCRIWQFVIGIVAFYFQENSTNQNKFSDKVQLLANEDGDDLDISVHDPVRKPSILFQKLKLYIYMLTILCISFSPIALPPNLVRPLATIFTGLLIVSGKEIDQNPLSNRLLVYIGDISYALYLVHWPLYVWVKCNYSEIIQAYLTAFVLSILISILISEKFEKWYLKLGIAQISILFIVQYVMVAGILLYSGEISRFITEHSNNLQYKQYLGRKYTSNESIRLNQYFQNAEYPNLVIPDCYPNNSEHGLCEFSKESLTGNLNILILGNSYAPNVASLIRDNFAKYASRMQKYSASSCEPLINKNKQCRQRFEDYFDVVNQTRPDILFLISRHIAMALNFTIPIENDDIAKKAGSELNKFVECTKKRIYVLGGMPQVGWHHMDQLNSFIKSGKNFSSKDFGHYQDYKQANIRLKYIVKKCEKCRLFDYSSVLQDNKGDPVFYDEETKLSYFTNGVHLTPVGLEAIRPVYEHLAEEFSKE